MANALHSKTSQPRTYGLATVKVGKKMAKVTFEESGDSYQFSVDDLPSKPKLHPESEDIYMVVLSEDKDTVEKIGPAEGHFKAKFSDFSRPEDGADPAPVEVEKEYNGKKTIYQKFTAFFEVLEGRYKGNLIPVFLRYKFACDDDNPPHAMWDGDPSNPKATHLPRLVEFCEKTGCVSSPIDWPEDGNILPELYKRIIKANRTVDLVVKKGWVDSILAADYEDAEEPDEEAHAPKAKGKAPAKKSKAVDPDEEL